VNALRERVNKGLLNSKIRSSEKEVMFNSIVSLNTADYLADHVIANRIIFPGTGYVELSLEAIQEIAPQDVYCLEQIAFKQALYLESHKSVQLLVLLDESYHISIYSLNEASEWIHHASLDCTMQQVFIPHQIVFEEYIVTAHTKISGAEYYAKSAGYFLNYGTQFQGIRCIYEYDGGALIEISLPPSEGYIAHPAVLDSCLQSVGCLSHYQTKREGITYVPVSIRRLLMRETMGSHVWVKIDASTLTITEHGFHVNLDIYSDKGYLISRLERLELKAVSPQQLQGVTVHETQQKHSHQLWAASALIGSSDWLGELEQLSQDEAIFLMQRNLSQVLSHLLQYDSSRFLDVNRGFFELGLDSLMLVDFGYSIERFIAQKIDLKCLTTYPTIKKLAEYLVVDLLSADNGKQYAQLDQEEHTLQSGKVKKSILSSNQQSIYFISKTSELLNSSYNLPVEITLQKTIPLETIKFALQLLMHRHGALRLKLMHEEHCFIQEEAQYLMMPVEVIRTANQEESKAALACAYDKPFDLDKAPLVRALIVNGVHYHILIVIHHILCDAHSVLLIQKDFYHLCSYLEGKESFIPEPAYTYLDYLLHKSNRDASFNVQEGMNFWTRYLHQYEPSLLIKNNDISANSQLISDACNIEIGEQKTLQIKQLAQQHNVTVFSLMVSIWSIIIARFLGQSDIVLGSMISNRNEKKFNDVVGFFASTLVYRIGVDFNQSIGDFFKAVFDNLALAQHYSYIDFSAVVDAIEPDRKLLDNPIFNILINETNLSQTDYDLNQFVTNQKIAKLPLKIHVFIKKSTITINLSFNVDLNKYHLVSQLQSGFLILLDSVLEDSRLPIGDYPYLTPAQIQKLCVTWNATEKEFPINNTMHQLFEEQVKKTPNHIALRLGNEVMLYHELNHRANQLARYIQQVHYECSGQKTLQDRLIGICMQRSFDLIVSLFAVLKAGAAYVPFEPDYPEKRLKFMLDDTDITIMLTHEPASLKCNQLMTHQPQKPCINLDEVSLVLAKLSAVDLESQCTSRHLVYVLYTSGSTGVPKGVMVTHKNLINYCYWATTLFASNPSSAQGSVFHSTIAFGGQVTTIYPVLLLGKTVCLTDPANSIEGLSNLLLQKEQFGLLRATPSHLRFLNDRHQDFSSSFDFLLIGGEPVLSSDVHLWMASGSKVHVHFGSTETTVGCCSFELNEKHLSQYSILPIGRPVFNTKVYVLDNRMQLVPVGVPGELYVAGAGIAKGYLNNPAQTKACFYDNPFETNSQYSVLYKSGDMVRWHPDGYLEFIGRNDFQVKINGFRIEMNEIESVLSGYMDIRHAAVKVEEHNKVKYLIAYYEASSECDKDILMRYIKEYLPDYMVPSDIVYLPVMPLTLNGKIDRSKLPSYDFNQKRRPYFAPKNAMEEGLCCLWEELLNLEKISVEDNFFHLGGNSILALQLAYRVKNELHVPCSVIDIIKHQTIAQLSKHLINIVQTSSVSVQVLHQLNHSQNKNVIYFIPPGIGGCEVYQSVVDELDGYCLAYGLANHWDNNSTSCSLKELALFYLNKMGLVHPLNQPIILFGWSLGGVIALEMACQLEKEGYKNILVYALDSSLYSEQQSRYLQMVLENTDVIEKCYGNYLIQHRIQPNESMHEKMKLFHAVGMSLEALSGRLSNTEIVFFNALQGGRLAWLTPEEKANYVALFGENRISNIRQHSGDGLRVIDLDCDHFSVFKHAATISCLLKQDIEKTAFSLTEATSITEVN